jgi:hypothetical protein
MRPSMAWLYGGIPAILAACAAAFLIRKKTSA